MRRRLQQQRWLARMVTIHMKSVDLAHEVEAADGNDCEDYHAVMGVVCSAAEAINSFKNFEFEKARQEAKRK
jgi:hypothetical protein